MKKIFEEYGGVIVTIIAIVGLFGVVGILMGGENGGVVGKSLKTQVSMLTGNSDTSVDGSISGSVPPAGSDNQPSISYTLEEIENNEFLYAMGSTKPEYVVVSFNEDYSVATVMVNGEGSDGIIKDYTGYEDEVNFSPLTAHASTLKKVNFKEGITVIGESTCLQNSNLTNVSLPDSLKSIGSQAFFECNNLSDISLPDNVSSIGMGAFGYCSSITSVVLPVNLTRIEYGLFMVCESLTDVVIPDGVVYIDDYGFGDCDKLVSVIIPESVTDIHELAFQHSFNFTTIKGVAGSYAETFANLRNYNFEAI